MKYSRFIMAAWVRFIEMMELLQPVNFVNRIDWQEEKVFFHMRSVPTRVVKRRKKIVPRYIARRYGYDGIPF